MFEALVHANVDWNVIAGAIATFVVTAIATAFGFRKGLRKLRDAPAPSQPVPFAGASLMDNYTMMQLTEALKENTSELRSLHPCLIELNVRLENRH